VAPSGGVALLNWVFEGKIGKTPSGLQNTPRVTQVLVKGPKAYSAYKLLTPYFRLIVTYCCIGIYTAISA
jgi:hypothetical protein